MTLKYLLDTNILSEAKRLKPNLGIMENLQVHREEIGTATLVVHELLFGCLRLPPSKKRQDLERYINEVILKSLPLLDYDLNSALYHAQERARLSKIGKTPSFVDGQIASIAFVNNLSLVTNNVDDFRDFNGLSVENWFLS
jgi:tRNA(fMet)-specific endonuclease VapC